MKLTAPHWLVVLVSDPVSATTLVGAHEPLQPSSNPMPWADYRADSQNPANPFKDLRIARSEAVAAIFAEGPGGHHQVDVDGGAHATSPPLVGLRFAFPRPTGWGGSRLDFRWLRRWGDGGRGGACPGSVTGAGGASWAGGFADGVSWAGGFRYPRVRPLGQALW